MIASLDLLSIDQLAPFSIGLIAFRLLY